MENLTKKPKIDENSDDISLMSICMTNEKTVNDLNHDSLIHVFTFLPIADKIRIERVCKRWYSACQDSWRNFKKLTFDRECWGWFPKSKIDNHVLRKILLRCGKFITCVYLFQHDKRFSGIQNITTIIKLCPNIEEFDARGFKISSREFKALTLNCSELTTIIIDTCTRTCDDSCLTFGLNFCKNLSCLSIHDVRTITGECSKSLTPTRIKKLTLIDCGKLRNGFDDILRVFVNLEELGLILVPDDFNINVDNILKLSYLQKINISNNFYITDDFIIKMCTNCKELKYLNINWCFSITDTGIMAIAALPKLEDLFLDGLSITGNTLIDIPNLKTLSCQNNYKLLNESIVSLIQTSEKLEKLNVSGCDDIANKVIDCAISAAKKRNNCVRLEIILRRTNIRPSASLEIPPLLKLTFDNLVRL